MIACGGGWLGTRMNEERKNSYEIDMEMKRKRPTDRPGILWTDKIKGDKW